MIVAIKSEKFRRNVKKHLFERPLVNDTITTHLDYCKYRAVMMKSCGGLRVRALMYDTSQ